MTPLDREELHRELDRILDDRELHEAELSSFPHLDRTLIKFGKFSQRVVGKLLDDADTLDPRDMPSVEDVALAKFARRLRYLAPVLDSDATLSTNDLADELLAIAHGDAPNLLRRRVATGHAKGFNLARWKLSAVIWEARLASHNIPTATRQGWIAEAYGAPWDTISRWLNQVEQRFGQSEVQRAFRLERFAQHLESIDPEYVAPSWDDLRASVLGAGRDYRAFQGYGSSEIAG